MTKPPSIVSDGIAEQIKLGAVSTGELGPYETWSEGLRQAAGIVFAAAAPMALVWGGSRALVCNEAFRALIGERGFEAVGRPIWEALPAWRDTLEPVIAQAFDGRASVLHDIELAADLQGQGGPAWFTVSCGPVPADGATPGVLCVCLETSLVHVERAAREDSERTLLFLDRLTRSTSSMASADAVMQRATELIGEHMGVSVCAYADMDEDEDGFTIRGDWAAPGSTSIVGHYRLADFGKMAVDNLSRGLPLVINDNRVEIAPHEAVTFQAIGIGSTICMPLVRDGRLRALMAVHHKGPHVWTDRELALAREVTERSWAFVERVGAEAELRASEDELRRITDAAPLLIAYVDGELRYQFVNRAYEAWFGQPREVIQGRKVEDVVGDGFALARPHLEAALAGRRVTFEGRVNYPAAGWRDVHVDYVPRRAADSAVIGLYAVVADVSTRVQAERALLESETRLRLATEFAEVGLWDVEAGNGALYWNDRVRALFGVKAGAPVALADFYGGLHPDDLQATAAAYSAAANPEQRAVYDVEYRTIGAEDGAVRWVAAKGRGLFDEAGRCVRVAGTAVEITDRKHAEEARDLLMREVDHRARNSLAVIQSVVRLTDATDPVAFRQAIHGRIEAMARAQAALAKSNWRGSTIGEVARDELLTSVIAASRVRLAGADIAISADHVQPLSMVLHELATNATKYGALSVHDGVVDVRWSGSASAWSLHWQESGGPPVLVPARSGFGSRLMTSLARQLNGAITFDWRPEGLSVDLKVETDLT